MKKLTVLFADFKNTLPFEKVFDGFSAFDRSIQWALSCKSDEILILSNDFSLANPDFPVKNGGKYKIISDDKENLELHIFENKILFKYKNRTINKNCFYKFCNDKDYERNYNKKYSLWC